MTLPKNEIVISQIRFSYYRLGQGRTLFLIPAFHSDVNRFSSLLDILARYFTVYIPELPGISTISPLGHYQHTAKNYALLLNKMIAKLGIEDYILSGFCLGAVIAVRLLQITEKPPSHLMFFEAIYDADYILFNTIDTLAIQTIKTFGPHNRLINSIIDSSLHSDKFLTLYFRLLYRHERHIDQVIPHQIKLTSQMNSRAWVELIYDIFSLHLKKENLIFNIPATLIYNIHDDILDTPKTIAGMKKTFPHSHVFNVNLTQHAPSGPIDKAFVTRLISPLLPILKSLSH